MKEFLKIALMILFAYASSISYADDILLWMLEDPKILNADGSGYVLINDLIESGQKISVVRIKTIDSAGNSTYLNIGTFDPDTETPSETATSSTGWRIPDVEGQWNAGPAYASLAGLDTSDPSLLFMMELGTFNSNNDWIVAAIGYETYKSIANNGHIIQSEFSYQGSSPWTGGTWAVPEPSIAMLVLLGTCCLLLKRRNMNSSAV